MCCNSAGRGVVESMEWLLLIGYAWIGLLFVGGVFLAAHSD